MFSTFWKKFTIATASKIHFLVSFTFICITFIVTKTTTLFASYFKFRLFAARSGADCRLTKIFQLHQLVCDQQAATQAAAMRRDNCPPVRWIQSQYFVLLQVLFDHWMNSELTGQFVFTQKLFVLIQIISNSRLHTGWSFVLVAWHWDRRWSGGGMQQHHRNKSVF